MNGVTLQRWQPRISYSKLQSLYQNQRLHSATNSCCAPVAQLSNHFHIDPRASRAASTARSQIQHRCGSAQLGLWEMYTQIPLRAHHILALSDNRSVWRNSIPCWADPALAGRGLWVTHDHPKTCLQESQRKRSHKQKRHLPFKGTYIMLS